MTNRPTGPALWQHLVQWQPATAAALAEHARALPDDWPARVFGVARTDAALTLSPGAIGEQFPDRAPEIAPYDEIAPLDDCPACEEAEGNCRFHEGYASGHHEALQAQLDAVQAHPGMGLREFMRWQADVEEAEDRGQEPPALPAPAAVPAVVEPPADRAVLDRVREIVRRLDAHAVGFQDVLDDSDRDPWAKTVRADIAELRRMADETPAAEARPESCAHCGKSVLRITGTLAAWWVHDPGGNTVCFPEQAASSPRATPKTADEPQDGARP
ncbi:hypothetical protein [Streptomyces sp. NBRC 110035]|uniref:hypothetical protein n=1 Tax=Streptomyces sp. NBRC 110035 TaxID=1547867 RepID=UPI0005A6C584|nr:hypothetical protein [Streptomyces sp. NBRC 110035]